MRSTRRPAQNLLTRLAPRVLSTVLLSGCLLGTLVQAGCAPSATSPDKPKKPGDDDGPATDFEFKTPSFSGFTPTHVSLGDPITVRGADFIDPKHGTLQLYLKGSFTNSAGEQNRYDGFVPLKYLADGKATFEFGAGNTGVFFSKTGQDIGTFHGVFQVVSTLQTDSINEEPGAQAISEAQTTDIVVNPSIYIEQLRSIDENCAAVTPATTAGANIALGVRAIGVAKGTPTAPVNFAFTVTAPAAQLAFVEDKMPWPLTVTPSALLAAKDGAYTISYDVTNDNAATLNPTYDDRVVHVSPPVTVANQQTATSVKLARLAAGSLAPKQDSSSMNITVVATGANGTIATRSINYAYFAELEMQASARSAPKDVQAYDLVEQDCTSGGRTGLNYMYTSGTSESKSRSINMSASTSLMGSLDVSVWIARASIASTQTFGYDVNESVSSESHTSVSGTINVLPGWVGASYRQAIRREITVPAVMHNRCGAAIPAGTLIMTDWYWHGDVNQGPSCAEVAPSEDALPVGPINK